MAEFSTRLGTRLRQLREERKLLDPRWTQDYVARLVRSELTGAQYARWERGEVMPREDTLERIAEVFEIPVEALYGSNDIPSAPEGFTYKAVDVERAERTEAKLDALLAHFGIEWITPDAVTKGKKKK